MSDPAGREAGTGETLARLWEEHMRHEFQTQSADDTIATMVDDAYVNHIPVLTGGSGKAELHEFYATNSSCHHRLNVILRRRAAPSRRTHISSCSTCFQHSSASFTA